MSGFPHVELYTDGACSPNPGLGGWGAILISPAHNRHTRELSGAQPDTTNNRMELTAVVEGLRALKRPCSVRVTTDSQYISKAFTNGWLDKWKRNNWQTARGSVKNQDLWRELDHLTTVHRVQWQWVKGHAGHPQNDRADELAVAARKAFDQRNS